MFRLFRVVMQLTLVAMVLVLAEALSAGGPAGEGRGDAGNAALTQRIERIEEGLLPPILIKDRPRTTMQLAQRMEHYGVPGLSIAVIDAYELAWSRSYGLASVADKTPVTPDTLFQAASISKVVAAAMTLQLVAAGRFELDDRANELLRSYKIPGTQAGGSEPILIRHLLSHSAGLTAFVFAARAHDENGPTLVETLQQEITRIAPPGESYAYSNPAYAILQQLVEDVSGKAFTELARERLFRPLAMSSSSFAPLPPAPLLARTAYGHKRDLSQIADRGMIVPPAVGGLWTTPSDLGRLLVSLLRAYRGDAKQVLPPGLAQAQVSRQVGDEGLGVALAGREQTLRLMHSGGMPGFRALLVAYPASGQGAVVMTNSDNGMNLIGELMRAVAAEYQWPGYVTEDEVIELPAEVFARYAGQYRFDPPVNLELDLYAKDGRYYRGSFEMLPESKTSFVVPKAGDRLDMLLDDEGRASAFTYTVASGQTVRAQRVD